MSKNRHNLLIQGAKRSTFISSVMQVNGVTLMASGRQLPTDKHGMKDSN